MLVTDGRWSWAKFVLVHPARNPSFAQAGAHCTRILCASLTASKFESLLDVSAFEPAYIDWGAAGRRDKPTTNCSNSDSSRFASAILKELIATVVPTNFDVESAANGILGSPPTHENGGLDETAVGVDLAVFAKRVVPLVGALHLNHGSSTLLPGLEGGQDRRKAIRGGCLHSIKHFLTKDLELALVFDLLSPLASGHGKTFKFELAEVLEVTCPPGSGQFKQPISFRTRPG
jgi:hypothetical protein